MAQMQGHYWFSGYAHLKMSWIQHQIHQKDGFLAYPPFEPSPTSSLVVTSKESSPSPPSSASKISPAVLFIIVILAVLFFISGLLHLLVRFLSKNPSSSESNRNLESNSAVERQLQQLFHLHDSGLDQAFIDALPVFSFKEIMGPKESFDCAVCLCEFSETDQLRLLPMCSHAFHIDCIDTWLLSNSSCPLCRGTLFNPEISAESHPLFNFDDFREEDGYLANDRKKGVFPLRLGKFRNVERVEEEVVGETSSSKLDGRRCYSMGSYQYLVGDVNLMVSVGRIDDVKGTEHTSDPSAEESREGKKICIGAKTDSYSISKIWLWSKKKPSSPIMDLPWIHRTEGV